MMTAACVALTASMAFFTAAPAQSPAAMSLARARTAFLSPPTTLGAALMATRRLMSAAVRPSGVAPATSTSCSRARSSRLWLESPADQVVRHGMPSTLRVERRSAPAAVSRSSRVARSRLRTLAISFSGLAGRRAATVASAPSSTGSPGGVGSTTTIRPRLTPPPAGGKPTRSIVTRSASTAPASTLSSLVESTRNLPVRSSTRSSRTSSAISIHVTLSRSPSSSMTPNPVSCAAPPQCQPVISKPTGHGRSRSFLGSVSSITWHPAQEPGITGPRRTDHHGALTARGDPDLLRFQLAADIADETTKPLTQDELKVAVAGRAIQLGTPLLQASEGSIILQVPQYLDATVGVQVLAALGLLLKNLQAGVTRPGHGPRRIGVNRRCQQPLGDLRKQRSHMCAWQCVNSGHRRQDRAGCV